MKTYKIKTSELSAELTMVESTLLNCVKRFNLYLGPRGKEFLGDKANRMFKAWARERGVAYDKLTIDDSLQGYGKYAVGRKYTDIRKDADGKILVPCVCVCKVPRYKLTADGQDFYFEEIEDKRGHKQYRKVIEFYTFEPKTRWTIADVATCTAHVYGEGKRDSNGNLIELEYALNTPYLADADGNLAVSDNPTWVERAQMTGAEEAEMIAALNAVDVAE